MTLLPVTAAPLPPAGCDPLAGLDAQGRHLFGLGVLHMADDLAAARRRIGELERRVANQRAVILSLKRREITARRDPAALSMIERIDRETAASTALEPLPQVPVDMEPVHVCGDECRSDAPEPKPARRESAAPCTDPDCGLCAAPVPSPQPPPGARRGGAFRFRRWPR